jgi:hypothetical protein
MAGPYDAVVSIGGQSFVDGFWRLLGPELEGLSNPLPFALPGFANARFRIVRFFPVIPGDAPADGLLHAVALVEASAEALLHVIAATDALKISIGSPNFTLTEFGGQIGLPAQQGSLNLGPTTGTLILPATTGNLTNGSGSGRLEFPDGVAVPAIPFPAVVPVAVNLTPKRLLTIPATLRLSVARPSATTRSSLGLTIESVGIGTITGIAQDLNETLAKALSDAVKEIVAQLGLPAVPAQPEVTADSVTPMIAPLAEALATAVDAALSNLVGHTGRLIFPAAGAGASCDVLALPTAADARLIAAADGTALLQIGFKRAGSGDVGAFPAFAPAGADCEVRVGNRLLLQLLCCLVERLPAFSLPVAATTDPPAIDGATHLHSCTFRRAGVSLAGVMVGGGDDSGISVCIDGAPGRTKTVTLIGHFVESVPGPFAVIGKIASIAVDFRLPLIFDLDQDASLAHLRVTGTPSADASVSPGLGLLALVTTLFAAIVVVTGGLTSLILGLVSGGAAVAFVFVVVYTLCGIARFLLARAARAVLAGASLLKSPAAVPPGLFEAFGRLSPVTMRVDDLTATAALRTPTSPWALLPRVGPRTPGDTGVDGTGGVFSGDDAGSGIPTGPIL